MNNYNTAHPLPEEGLVNMGNSTQDGHDKPSTDVGTRTIPTRFHVVGFRYPFLQVLTPRGGLARLPQILSSNNNDAFVENLSFCELNPPRRIRHAFRSPQKHLTCVFLHPE